MTWFLLTHFTDQKTCPSQRTPTKHPWRPRRPSNTAPPPAFFDVSPWLKQVTWAHICGMKLKHGAFWNSVTWLIEAQNTFGLIKLRDMGHFLGNPVGSTTMDYWNSLITSNWSFTYCTVMSDGQWVVCVLPAHLSCQKHSYSTDRMDYLHLFLDSHNPSSMSYLP